MDARSEELLRAIVATPADNEVRLVCADHIASRWPAHAALIVAQCTNVDAPSVREAFLAELPDTLRNQVHTKRGFADVDCWRLEARDFIELDPDDLFRLAPACTAVDLQDCEQFAPIARRMHRFDSLTIRATYLDAARAHELATVGGLAHLLDLGFDHTSLVDANVAEVVGATAFPVLERLRLPGAGMPCSFSIETLRRIAEAPFVDTLRALDVSAQRLPSLVEVIATLPALRELDASGSFLDAELAGLPQRFEELRVAGCGLDDEAAAALASSSLLAEIQVLEAMANPWSCDALAALIGSAQFGPVRNLSFDGSVHLFGGRGHPPVAGIPAALARSRARTTIAQLSIAALQLDSTALQVLAATEFPSLRWIMIVECALPARAARILAGAPWIPQLEVLAVGAAGIDLEGARALVSTLPSGCMTSILGGLPNDVLAILRAHLGDRLVAVAA